MEVAQLFSVPNRNGYTCEHPRASSFLGFHDPMNEIYTAFPLPEKEIW